MKSTVSNMSENSVLEEVKLSRKREQHMQVSGVNKWKLPAGLWWSWHCELAPAHQNTHSNQPGPPPALYTAGGTYLADVTPAGTDKEGWVPWFNYFQFQRFGVQTTVFKMSKYDLGKMKG